MATTTTEETLFVREQLIRGGLGLIDADGTEALSVRRLAQAADRTTMCVYTKFGGRSGLLMAIFDRAARELLGSLGDSPADDLRAWGSAHPERYRFLFEVDPRQLGVDPSLRASLLDDVLTRLGGPDPESAWTSAHGEIVLTRIRAEATPA